MADPNTYDSLESRTTGNLSYLDFLLTPYYSGFTCVDEVEEEHDPWRSTEIRVRGDQSSRTRVGACYFLNTQFVPAVYARLRLPGQPCPGT